MAEKKEKETGAAAAGQRVQSLAKKSASKPIIEKRGRDVFSFPNNDRYVGEYLAQYPDVLVRDGFGIYLCNDGLYYKGQWEKDHFVNGMIKWVCGQTYTGPLKDGKYNGYVKNGIFTGTVSECLLSKFSGMAGGFRLGTDENQEFEAKSDISLGNLEQGCGVLENVASQGITGSFYYPRRGTLSAMFHNNTPHGPVTFDDLAGMRYVGTIKDDDKHVVELTPINHYMDIQRDDLFSEFTLAGEKDKKKTEPSQRSKLDVGKRKSFADKTQKIKAV